MKLFLLIIFYFSFGVIISAQTEYSEIDSYIDSLSLEQKAYELTEILDQIDIRFDTEMDKVRAVFKWIGRMIVYDHNYDENESGLILESKMERIRMTLEKGRGTCLDYSYLFDYMCSYLSLRSGIIDGIVKLKRDETVVDIKSNRHVWNFISINDEDYFIDVTWGDFYYLIPPSKFIFTHFPDDQDWQMISSPYSLEQFFNMPYVNAKVFYRNEYIIDVIPKQNINLLEDTSVRIRVKVDMGHKAQFKIGVRDKNKFWIRQKTNTVNDNGYLSVDIPLSKKANTREIHLMIKSGLKGYKELMTYKIK